MRRGVIPGVLSLVAALALAAEAAAQSSPEVLGPYDGHIPFNCQLQNVGTGTAFPHPEADPFCVEYDKTNQNVTDFGLVEFAAQEPARIAAAVRKCFYFQRDHWTGSIVQGSAPELWHWDGDYFFDRAKGVGGVSVRNFRIGGTPQDATPFVPPAYRPFFDESGGGGVLLELETKPDPACAARVDTPEEQAQVYGGPPPGGRCIDPGGELLGKRVGRARLGLDRSKTRSRLGPPRSSKRGVDRWCLVGKGRLRIAYARGDGPARVIQTSSRGHAARGVARGDRARRARRRLELEPLFKLASTRVFEAADAGKRRLLVGIAAHRVRWLAVAAAATDDSRRLRRILRRMR